MIVSYVDTMIIITRIQVLLGNEYNKKCNLC